jgi:protein CMS1
MEEAVTFLNTHRTGIAVGTPVRLMDLLDNGLIPSSGPSPTAFVWLTKLAGALSVDNLKRIVVDASHIDQKKRGVMDMKETMVPLAKWLVRKEFKERYTDPENRVDLMFY